MPDKVAIITAAGSGLGAGIAKELAAQGWRVAVSSSSGKGEALGKSLGGLGFTASNDDPQALERVVKGTLDAWGRVDAVVNSCGHPPKGDLLAISDQDWHRGLDMILLSVVRLSRLVTPAMERQGGGAIVNGSTFAAFGPDLAFPVSCALRAALGSFAKLYADRYAQANIRTNNVPPGSFDSLPEKEAAKQRVPLGRYGKVEELAKTVAFLISDGAGYITGQNLRVDGGITRSV
ncbi:MAG: SDR family oxidoreductase [Alphaproteobacteria bacterium]|nr:SDR family oxidoreductase [Alphaproteobacteria bacterium]